jgi:hypothetical protein
MRVVINEEHAAWVRQIFRWFVDERRTLRWIVCSLSQLNAPKDHRSSTKHWHHAYVKRMLRNEKYIGIWRWGQKTNTRNPLTGQVRQEERPSEEAAKVVRERPDLRLVDDQTFIKAQALLDELEATWAKHRGEDGALNGSPPGATSPRHLLQGVFKCGNPECGRTLQVGGAKAHYLVCPGFRCGSCSLKTGLARDLAREKVLSFLRECLFAQPQWLEAVLQEGEHAWEMRQRQKPNELVEVERNLATVNNAIKHLVDAVEKGSDVGELTERLNQRRQEKIELERRQACLLATAAAPAERITRDWMVAQLQRLEEILESDDPAANRVLKAIVGGNIRVAEAIEPGRKRKYLVGTFTFSSNAIVTALGSSVMPDANSPAVQSEEVTIEFRKETPWASLADEAKRLFDAGPTYERIAEELDCPYSWVAKAIATWHSKRALPALDGRKHRGRLDREAMAEALAEKPKSYGIEICPCRTSLTNSTAAAIPSRRRSPTGSRHVAWQSPMAGPVAVNCVSSANETVIRQSNEEGANGV